MTSPSMTLLPERFANNERNRNRCVHLFVFVFDVNHFRIKNFGEKMFSYFVKPIIFFAICFFVFVKILF
jgi:hypothetical protein